MPRPKSSHTNPFRGRVSDRTRADRDIKVDRLEYHLEKLSEDRWVRLAGFTTLERALKEAPSRSGVVMVRDHTGKIHGAWCAGVALTAEQIEILIASLESIESDAAKSKGVETP